MTTSSLKKLSFLALVAITATACSKGSDSKSKQSTGPVGAKFASTCVNPVSFELAEGEEEVKVSSFVDGTEGEYVLVRTLSFTEIQNAAGSDFLSGEGDVSGAKQVTCHTAKADQKLSANLDMPASFSSKDGKVAKYRRDSFEVLGAKESASSDVYARSEQLKDDNGELPEGGAYSVTKNAKGEITIKLRLKLQSDNAAKTPMILSIAGTYKRK